MATSHKYTTILIVFILILTTARSIVLFNTYGCTDLRVRVVGARLMIENKSPYFYKWQPGDRQEILDPNVNQNRNVNGNVVTPAYLVLMQPFVQLSYYQIQIAWGILQCLFVCAVIWLSAKYFPLFNLRKSLLPVAVILLFSFSDIWLYNIERGQTYTLFAFLFSLVVILPVTTPAKFSWFGGIINGLIGFLRPSFFLLIIVFFIRKNYRFCLGQIAGALIGLLLFVLPYFDVWKDFFAAMKTYSLEIINGMPAYHAISNAPGVIENLSTLRNFNKDIQLSAMLSVQNYLKNIGIILTSTTSTLLCIISISAYAYFYYKKKLYVSSTRTILFAFLVYITAEYFFIGARGPYSLIQWLLPLYILAYDAGIKRALVLLLAFSQIFIIPSLPFEHSQSFQGFVGEGILYLMCVYDIYIKKTTSKIPGI